MGTTPAPWCPSTGMCVAQMTASATACAGLLYDLNPEHFNEWSESVVSALMAL